MPAIYNVICLFSMSASFFLGANTRAPSAMHAFLPWKKRRRMGEDLGWERELEKLQAAGKGTKCCLEIGRTQITTEWR